MPKPKGAGDLRDRVKFQRRQAGTDEYGNAVTGWEDLGIERWASLLPARGGEQTQAGRIAGKAQWDCWVRSDSHTRTITHTDRIVDARDSSRTFNISFVGDMDGDRKWLLIQAESGVANG